MAWNVFNGWSEVDLLALRRQLQEAYANTLMAASAGSVSSQNVIDSAKLKERIQAVEAALTALDPLAYPASANERRSRVGADFSNASF